MTNEVKEIAVRPEGILSARDVQARVNIIQEVMKNVMEENVHFGKIPGCPKPSLFKAGAEKIAMTFQMDVQSAPEDLSTADEKRYRVTCTAYSAGGIRLGSAVGECSSNEEKYKWRAPKCDAEYDATPSDRKRIKWDAQGNETRQIRTEHADQANTILQMADKRAYVACVRKVTAASDIFTQDIEDLDGVPGGNGEAQKPVQKPKPKADALSASDFKPFKSKFKGTCKGCGQGFEVGAEILYSKALGTYHPSCIKPKEEEKPSPSAAATVTPALLKNLEAMAIAAKQKLIDRIGRDGLESTDQITNEYAQELMMEFAGIIEAKK